MLVDDIEKLKDLKVLFIGETIIDEYNYVLPLGKTPKEHMIAVQYQDNDRFVGGIVAAAKHLQPFCEHVTVATNGEPHIVKSRYVDKTYNRKLFEVYFSPTADMLAAWRLNFCQHLEFAIPNYDAVVVIDYGHGLIDQETADIICRKSKFLAVNTQSNSANWGFNIIGKYYKTNLVCLDAAEARLAARDNLSSIEDVVMSLPKLIPADSYIVTHGKNGCLTLDIDGLMTSIPAVTQKVTDTMGAGDAFLAIAAPLVAVGVDLNTAASCGNIAGGMKTGIVGHSASIEKDKFMEAANEFIR
jgi:bifunctional ADP-heptose synthase (sugar kinase/adenylyltransferase)